MGALYNALESLASVRDAEVLDGFRRYEALLATILTPEQLEIYAAYLLQSREVRVFEELTPDELAALPPGVPAIAAAIVADTNISMENRRVPALLHQHGEHDLAPDFEENHERSLQK